MSNVLTRSEFESKVRLIAAELGIGLDAAGESGDSLDALELLVGVESLLPKGSAVPPVPPSIASLSDAYNYYLNLTRLGYADVPLG